MTYTRTISLGDDILDPRDIVERVEELDEFLDSEGETWEGSAEDFVDEFADEVQERSKWRELLEDIDEDEALILDSHFEEYAQQLAEDIGAIPEEYSWPTSYIDWDAAATALKQDYSAVEIDGYTYWQRA